MDLNGIYFEGQTRVRRIRSRGPGLRAAIKAVTASKAAPLTGADAFIDALAERLPVALERYRMTALRRRLPACLRAIGSRDVEDARRRISEGAALIGPMLDTVLLGVTEFFRDPHVFDFLRTSVLPPLFQSRPRVRILSAACSSGQELYSVAMMLRALDYLDAAELVGTDCRESAIRAARAGEFGPEELDTLPAAWSTGCIDHTGPSFKINASLRASVRWEVSDLLETVEPGPWDLILCRNMAIYLNAEAAEAMWHRLIGELSADGCLVIGKADHPPEDLPIERIGSCVFRKRSPSA